MFFFSKLKKKAKSKGFKKSREMTWAAVSFKDFFLCPNE